MHPSLDIDEEEEERNGKLNRVKIPGKNLTPSIVGESEYGDEQPVHGGQPQRKSVAASPPRTA